MAKKKQPGTALSTLTAEDIEAALAKGAMSESVKALMASEPIYSNLNIIRQKSGDWYLGDKKLKKPLPVVILTTAFGQFFYEEKYDADNKVPPVCFALANTEGELMPSDSSPKKQHEGLCHTCPQNMKGSAGDGTYARACSARRRVAILFADDESQDPQTGSLEISPAGLREFSQYLQGIANMYHVHPAMFETLMDTKLSRNGDGSAYGIPVLGRMMTRVKPEWLVGDADLDVGTKEWFDTTLIGKKVNAAIDSKMLLQPPSLTVPTGGGGGKKPVTGAKRVSVKDAKAAKKAKK